MRAARERGREREDLQAYPLRAGSWVRRGIRTLIALSVATPAPCKRIVMVMREREGDRSLSLLSPLVVV